jgi:glycosyltransferase involved in cell wall biosynthesis
LPAARLLWLITDPLNLCHPAFFVSPLLRDRRRNRPAKDSSRDNTDTVPGPGDSTRTKARKVVKQSNGDFSSNNMSHNLGFFMRTQKLKVGWVTWWPVPYWTDRFNALSAHPDVDLKCYFLSSRSNRLPCSIEEGDWSFSYDFVSSRSDSIGYFNWKTWLRVPQPWTILRDPVDTLVMNYGHPTTAAATLACIAMRRPYFVFAPNTLNDHAPRPAPVEKAKRFLMTHANGILVTGSEQRRFVSAYVNQRCPIYTIGNPSQDLSHYRSDVHNNRQSLRRLLGIDDAVVLLFVGRFEQDKGLDILIDALRTCSHYTHRYPLAVILAGAGPLEQSIANAMKPLAKVICPGFVEGEELAKQFGVADIFILPSRREPWGLVVNQAMEFALPVIVSNRVGCKSDLVDHGQTGFIFDLRNHNELATYIDALASDKCMRKAFGSAAKEKIGSHTIGDWVEKVVFALKENHATRADAARKMPKRQTLEQ